MKVDDVYIENRANLCYNGNTKLKKAGVDIGFTEEQVREYVKCVNDPVYFIKNYVQIVNLDRGLIDFDLYDYQEEMIEAFSDNRFVVALTARQMGKCLAKDTMIKIRNKTSGDIYEIEIGKFYDNQK